MSTRATLRASLLVGGAIALSGWALLQTVSAQEDLYSVVDLGTVFAEQISLARSVNVHEAPVGRHPEQRLVVVGYGHLLDAHRGKKLAGVRVRRGVEQEVGTALADELAKKVKRVGAKIPVNDPGGAGGRPQLASFEKVLQRDIAQESNERFLRRLDNPGRGPIRVTGRVVGP